MTSREIRQSFLDFFASKQHRIIASAPVIPHGDPTLLFTNAGMNQFKEVFLGTGKRDYTRVADTQKCIRVSGKHNDLEEVGRDTYHHTFFEMLGNWSFGDYYKPEAIAWAWELLTDVWKLPKQRLWATVYRTDDEAFELWKSVTDIDHSHILRFDEKDNFWEMGETGPCGPCSEIHIDLTPSANASASLVNAGNPQLIEIWNLVFIQHNRTATGRLENLPTKHVDTGMGFERVCSVMNAMDSGFRRPASNYDSDVFTPIISRISEISGRKYGAGGEADIAMRVIADHIRALTFAIADGALPANEGRGYVLRRILRRGARFGRNLGLHEPFLYKLVATLVSTMSHVFPEIKEHQQHIERVVKGEEESFNQTLDRGLEIFEEAAKRAQGLHSTTISGEDAFRLYDTFGFPPDLTLLLARERGMSVDEKVFGGLMDRQRERSRESREAEAETHISGSKDRIRDLIKEGTEEKFRFDGYDLYEEEVEVQSAVENIVFALNTPFYAESGGQVGDTGRLTIPGHQLKVIDTQKSGKVNVHILASPFEWPRDIGKAFASIDVPRRLAIMRNHTATHLLHAALRQVLGAHVHQAGSLVAPDHLRFDFAHFARVSEAELSEIENIVNERIRENIRLLHHRDIPFAEAQKMGALMFFGDKYGDKVNVVQFGEFSKEFCGGTHVKSTGEIGFFKIRSESSSASGVRRIDAVTDDFAAEYLRIQGKTYDERVEYAHSLAAEILKLWESLPADQNENLPMTRDAVSRLDRGLSRFEDATEKGEVAGTGRLGPLFEGLQRKFHELEDRILRLSEMKKALEKAAAKHHLDSALSDIDELVRKGIPVDGFKIVASSVQAADMEALKSIGDTLRARIGSGVGLLAAVIEQKIALVCVVSDDLIKSKNIQAGKIVAAVAKVVGGGGGGKPHLATAGGKDVSRLDEALKSLEGVVRGML